MTQMRRSPGSKDRIDRHMPHKNDTMTIDLETLKPITLRKRCTCCKEIFPISAFYNDSKKAKAGGSRFYPRNFCVTCWDKTNGSYAIAKSLGIYRKSI